MQKQKWKDLAKTNVNTYLSLFFTLHLNDVGWKRDIMNPTIKPIHPILQPQKITTRGSTSILGECARVHIRKRKCKKTKVNTVLSVFFCVSLLFYLPPSLPQFFCPSLPPPLAPSVALVLLWVCIVLQRVAACCSVLQRVAVCWSVL